MKLNSRQQKALEILEFECSYEDAQDEGEPVYIERSKLARKIGDKTLADLVRLGLIDTGINKYSGNSGFRITETGLSALEK
ncbi:hypothetical protein OO012_18235 [Rhodobacteraceae bacterium KMM 6894]|nr:hypothetical protein [Rhodobacteraceae bacterium KMM 6894]